MIKMKKPHLILDLIVLQESQKLKTDPISLHQGYALLIKTEKGNQ